MNAQLFFHNIFFLLGGVINIILAVFVIYNRRSRIDVAAITFALMALSVATFQISHVLGIMAGTAEISRYLFMYNLANIPIGIFMTHWFLALIEKNGDLPHKIALIFIYITGIALFVTYLIFPDTFLSTSVPKLYFPFYYEPGSLHTLMRVWFNLVGVYYFIQILLAYRNTDDPVKRNRYKYVMLSILYGFVLGSTAILLIYDITFNPMWSAFFGFYTIPLAYAMVRYELLDIKILAKRAFSYAIVTAVIGLAITGINIFNDYIVSVWPNFPQWIAHAFTAIITAWLAIFIWKKSKESDLLKYEFLSVITHKFRTPLTRIKWSAETIAGVSPSNEEIVNAVQTIKESNEELVELTDTLTTLGDAESVQHLYHFKKVSLSDVLNRVEKRFILEFKTKNITYARQPTPPEEEITVMIDPGKLDVAFDTFFQNSLLYTPKGGQIETSISRENSRVYFVIKDSGIGIPKASQPYIFSKFYRSHTARSAHTEGTGIGLFMAKKIIERAGGTISIHSEGEGRGTKVTVSFPLAK
jgi:signal transduction histidine kinase